MECAFFVAFTGQSRIAKDVDIVEKKWSKTIEIFSGMGRNHKITEEFIVIKMAIKQKCYIERIRL